VKYAPGDRISYTHPVTGETSTGTILKSQPLRDWQGNVLVEEVLSITWDNGTVDHAMSTDGVEKEAPDATSPGQEST
jgi:hypothetical protein